MKGKRTKRYIGLALGMLLALYSAATPLGTVSVRAAGESSSEIRGGY